MSCGAIGAQSEAEREGKLSEGILLERRGKILLITLDNPPVNALSYEKNALLHSAFLQLQNDEELAVGVVTNKGQKVFSAGWDLKAVAASTSADTLVERQPAGGWAGIAEYWELHKPVIAAVNGHAIGGGFELALACDLIVASTQSDFWLPEMERGFLPDAGAIQRLPRRVPYNVAMDLMLTGRRMSAAEAKHWGLVSYIAEPDKVLDEAMAIASRLAEGAPLALQALKAVMLEIATLPLPDAMARVKKGKSRIPIYERMMNSQDFFEGPRAFVEKRKPVWKGR
jgi:crotonobetainyl-CoA hydratase